MKRFVCITLLPCLCVAWALVDGRTSVAAEGEAGKPTRPNVVLVLADDLGYGDLAVHGNPHVRTPQIDAFARDAVECTRCYVSPICSPTRASLLTGRYTARTFREVSYHMDPAEVTVAEALRAAGYKTGLFGKWHLGDGADENALAQGFDEVLTFTKGKLPVQSLNNPELIHNGKTEKYQGYCLDVFTEAAMNFMRENRARPFFVYLPANLIHEPLGAPAELVEPYVAADLKADLPKLYGMTENLDRNFGRIRATLAELGLAENTLLVFLSDNGPQIRAAAELERSAKLNGGKGTVYEGGIRVPCFYSWPAAFAGGKQVEHVVAHIDYMPTVLAACGVSPPENVKLDGRNLLPLLRDPAAAWPERTLFIQFDSDGPPTRELGCAAITDRWKLVQPCGADKQLKGLAAQYARLAAAAGRGKRSIAGNTPRFELYDLAADPGETKNLMAEQPEIATQLRKQYNAWFDDVSATARWKSTATP